MRGTQALGRKLVFGDVVYRRDLGRGVVCGVTEPQGTLIIAFESESVCAGYQGLVYIGSIFNLPMPVQELEKPLDLREPKALEDHSRP